MRKYESSIWEVFLVFLRLGFTSFGGPIAALGYFNREFVEKRKWVSQRGFAALIGFTQFLPGAASSKMGIALGLLRRGIPGAFMAWLGFTLPSAVIMILFGLWFGYMEEDFGMGWVHGLKVVSVAVVAQAIWDMGKSLCPDKLRSTIAVIAVIETTLFPGTLGQVVSIVSGAILGLLFLRSDHDPNIERLNVNVGRFTAFGVIVVFFLLLFILPLLAESSIYALQLFDNFYRTGALVFGGGHVLLPLLRVEVVPTGWVSDNAFLAGYGIAQALPGPLFTFAGYLGSISSQSPNGVLGGIIAIIAVFLPSFLLVIGILPFWEHLRSYKMMQYAILGINAAVVGLLISAFYYLIWTHTIVTGTDFSLTVLVFLLLNFWNYPPWLVIPLMAVVAGFIFN